MIENHNLTMNDNGKCDHCFKNSNIVAICDHCNIRLCIRCVTITDYKYYCRDCRKELPKLKN